MKEQPIVNEPLEISEVEVQFWKAEVQAAIRRQKDEFIARTGYEELIRYYESVQLTNASTLDQMAILDEFSPAVTSVVQNAFYQLPSINITATHPLAEEPVQVSEIFQLLNPTFKPYKVTELFSSSIKYGMKKIGMKEEMQMAAFDLEMAGFACVEINHKTEMGQPKGEEVKEPGLLEKVGEFAKGIYDKVTGNPQSQEEAKEEVAEKVGTVNEIFSDQTYCKRWNPLDILFDPKASVFKESRCIIKVVRMSIAEFDKAYPKFKGRITKANDGAFESIQYSAHQEFKDRNNVTLYELEIKKKGANNCILVVADGIQEAVDYYQSKLVTNGFKVKYRSLDKYGRIYPVSRARKAKKCQDDINHYLTVVFEHIDRSNRKIAYFEEGLTEQGKTAMRSADVFSLVPKKSPGAVFEAMPAPSVVPENKEIIKLLTESINKHIGSNELAKSGVSDHDTLGQDELQASAFQGNLSSLQDTLGDLSDDILDTLKDIQMQVWDGQDFFKVTGLQGGDSWYNPQMGPLAELLVGDVLVQTQITSAQKPDAGRDRKEALELANFIMSPDVQTYLQLRGKISNMVPLENAIKSFNQNPDIMFDQAPPPPMMPPRIPGGLPPQVPQEEQLAQI